MSPTKPKLLGIGALALASALTLSACTGAAGAAEDWAAIHNDIAQAQAQLDAMLTAIDDHNAAIEAAWAANPHNILGEASPAGVWEDRHGSQQITFNEDGTAVLPGGERHANWTADGHFYGASEWFFLETWEVVDGNLFLGPEIRNGPLVQFGGEHNASSPVGEWFWHEGGIPITFFADGTMQDQHSAMNDVHATFYWHEDGTFSEHPWGDWLQPPDYWSIENGELFIITLNGPFSRR